MARKVQTSLPAAIETELESTLQTLAPEVENPVVVLNARFAAIVNEQNERLTSDLQNQAGRYLTPREHAGAMHFGAMAYSQILERMVRDAVNAAPDLAPNLRYVAGPRQPNWVGIAQLEGFLFELTTVAATEAYYARRYGENLVVHFYTRPEKWVFEKTANLLEGSVSESVSNRFLNVPAFVAAG